MKLVANSSQRLPAHTIDARLLLVIGLALIAPTVIKYYWPVGSLLDVTGHPLGRDFINVWIGPQLAYADRMSTLFDLRAYHDALGELYGTPLPFHNWGYPLFVLPVYWLFAQMPYLAALASWTLLFLASFTFVAASAVPPERRWLVVLLVVLAPASIINAVGGQNGFLSATLLLGSILLLDRRPIVAGALIGLLAFKPHLGLCLPFVLIALGAWRTFFAAVITVVALLAMSVLAFGIEPWLDYVRVVGPYQTSLLVRFEGFFTCMMVSVTSGARAVGIPYTVALSIQLVVSAGVLITTVLMVRRCRDARSRAILIAAATPLITPYAFNYDLTALSAAIAWLVVERARLPDGGRLVLLTAWLVPALVMVPGFSTLGLAPLILIAAFVTIVKHVSRTATKADDAEKLPTPKQPAPA